MTFSMFCVDLVIIVVILGISAFVGFLMIDCTGDYMFSIAWLINGICFEICLTIFCYIRMEYCK